MAYTPTTWSDGDVITAEKMNKLEQGVKNEQVGAPGAAAGFGTPTATVDANTGVPSVTVTASGANTAPVMITQSEYMRRMKEMANIQAGMSFYGEMPDMFNLILNSDHKLIKEVLNEEESACQAEVAPIQSEMDAVNKQRNELKDKQKGKKDEDIPTSEKDELNDLDKKWDDLKSKKEAIFVGYASNNKVIRQLIDLALLQNNMLKGEALNNFVKRSIELI